MGELSRTVEVAPYDGRYKDQVIRLILSIQREEYAIPITLEDQPDLNDISAFYQVRQGNFWVALSEGTVVGTVALLGIGEGRLALRKMFVVRECRGSGSNAAAALLGTALHWARRNGIVEILLGTTDRFLAAHRFYEKNGFVRIEREDLPRSFPIMAVDSRFYRLSLKTEQGRALSPFS